MYIRINSIWFKDSHMNNETIHIHTYQENLEIQNLAGFSLSFFYGHAWKLVESLFPHQGSNPCPSTGLVRNSPNLAGLKEKRKQKQKSPCQKAFRKMKDK